MADPICRWRNTSIKQVSEFTQILPHCPMRKDAARAFVEKQWHEWDGGNDFSEHLISWQPNLACIMRMIRCSILVLTIYFPLMRLADTLRDGYAVITFPTPILEVFIMMDNLLF